MILPLGFITVPTPGTPVKLSAAIASALGVSPTIIRRLNIQAQSGNAGNIYLGSVALIKSTGLGLMCILSAGQTLNLYDDNGTTAAPSDSGWVIRHGTIMDLSRLWIDADDANNGIGGYAIY